jgi:hypothetical protein
MKVIKKKAYSTLFNKVVSGEKTFDLRLADWDCQPGDTLELVEVDEKTKKPTGRTLQRKVGYVLKTKDLSFWAKKDVDEHGYQIISLVGE